MQFRGFFFTATEIELRSCVKVEEDVLGSRPMMMMMMMMSSDVG